MTEIRDASNSKSSEDPEQDATNASRAGEAFCRAPRPGGAFFSRSDSLFA